MDAKGYLIFVSWDKDGLGEKINLPKFTHTALLVVRHERVPVAAPDGKTVLRDRLSPRVISFLPENPSGMRLPGLLRFPVPSVDKGFVDSLFPDPGEWRAMKVSVSYPIEIPLTELARIEKRIDDLREAGGKYSVGAGPRKGWGMQLLPADNCYTRVAAALGLDPSESDVAPGLKRGTDATNQVAQAYLRRHRIAPLEGGHGDPSKKWIVETLTSGSLERLPSNMKVEFCKIDR
jgi:hypothetical protein